ncbi:MAG: hypothetical protein AB7F64_04905 [Gammaproteobacteria bacterium]
MQNMSVSEKLSKVGKFASRNKFTLGAAGAAAFEQALNNYWVFLPDVPMDPGEEEGAVERVLQAFYMLFLLILAMVKWGIVGNILDRQIRTDNQPPPPSDNTLQF